MRTWYVVVFVLGLLLAGAVFPSLAPLSVSYVTTGSMKPTIGVGSGVVLVTVGDAEPGDIVTYYAETKDVYVTHRVVRKTDEGFVTKGDNNPSTDQAAGTPPVDRDQIVGRALTVAGTPLVIPHLGTVARWVQSNTLLAVLGSLALVLVVNLFEGGSHSTARDVVRARTVVIPVLLVALVALVAFTFLTATHAPVPYAVEEGGGDTPAVLPAGEPTARTHVVRLTQVPLTTVQVSADGATVTETSVASRSPMDPVGERLSLEVTTRLGPQPPGRHRTSVHVYTYPATLPEPALAWLHDRHPLVAATVSSALLFAPVFLGYLLFVDGHSPLRPSRRRRVHRLLSGGGR